MSPKSPLAAEVQGGGGKASTRPFRIIAILGAPASGKSSLTQELVDERLKVGGDVRVLDPAGNWPEYGEWPELEGQDESPEDVAERWIKELLRTRPRGQAHKPLLIVLEDADGYLTKPPRPVWKKLFSIFRHYRLDIIINSRRTQDLPLLIFTSATNVYIFRHFVSTSYLQGEYGSEVTSQIPEEPFNYIRFDVESREITPGKTKARAATTVSDGSGAGQSKGWF